MKNGAGVRVLNSAVPGRARLRVPGIKRKDQAAERVRRVIEQLPGVVRSRANPLTGSVLVEWEPSRQTLAAILECVTSQVGAGEADRATPETAVTADEWKPLLIELVKRLPAYLRLGWALARTPEIAVRKKAGLVGGVLYSLAPIDLVPGFIPVLGQLDDLGFLLLGIRSALRACPPGLRQELLAGAELEPVQLDRDIAALGRIGRSFGWTVARGAARQTGAVGRMLGRQIKSGARQIWAGYRSRTQRREDAGS